MHYACANGHLDVVYTLLHQRADINRRALVRRACMVFSRHYDPQTHGLLGGVLGRMAVPL